MLKIDFNKTIHLTRGDTANIDINIFYEDSSQPYVPQSSDVVKFSVKQNITDTTYIFQKTAIISDGAITVKILPTDTSSKAYGQYYYDVELKKSNGDTYTVVPCSSFCIEPEVTTS